ncbi:O-antigen ligase family protein [Alcaligenaceae bacterium]|nr:O-antigen ligase family protein [Alcaligenaceae bacterium]
MFYAINQSVPSGYSVGAALLLVASAFYLAQGPLPTLTMEEKISIAALAGFFVVAVFIYFWHGNPLSTLDVPSRFLLAIPVFLMLIQVPPRLSWLWAGVAVGSYGAGGVALWQIYGLGMDDVDGLTNGVRFGGICTMLAILCVAGLLWARRDNTAHPWPWRLALCLGVLAAGYGSLMSGTRGAWISLPLVFVLFCLGTFNRGNLYRACMAALVILLAAGAWYVVVPSNPLKAGYDQAVEDISGYVENGNAQGSISGRFELWRAALINIPDKPIFGWNERDYRARLEEQVANKELDPHVLNLAHTHNLYLETMLRQGLVGLIPILALFVFPFLFFFRRLRAGSCNVRILAIAGTCQLVVFGMLGASHVVLYRNDTLLFFFITLMVLWGCMRQEERQSSGPSSSLAK